MLLGWSEPPTEAGFKSTNHQELYGVGKVGGTSSAMGGTSMKVAVPLVVSPCVHMTCAWTKYFFGRVLQRGHRTSQSRSFLKGH